MQIIIMRSAQSVLHKTMSREEADRIGQQIAENLMKPGNLEKAQQRYNSNCEFEIGERAAKEYVQLYA